MSKQNVDTSTHFIKEWTMGVQVEDAARQQLANAASLPFIHKHIAVMPDVHAGRGCTVGAVIPTHKAIVPAFVGVDIGCVDCDTEFLTTSGWKRIADYQENDDVLVFDTNTEKAFFERAQFIKLNCSDGFWHIKTKYGINQMLSDEHSVLYYQYTRKGEYKNKQIISAGELAEKHNNLQLGFRGRFLTTFNLVRETSIDLTDEQLRVMIMVCADGHLSSKGNGLRCKLSLKKQKKIKRAQLLLKNADIEYKIKVNKWCTTIRFYAPIRTKTLSSFWDASSKQLRIICDEVFYWDGNHKDRVFYTSDKPSADFMSYAFAACGHRSVMRVDNRGRVNLEYRVFAHPNTKISISGSPNKKEFKRIPSKDGYKYCFTTSTGFWVMRRGGVVVVTGNCGMVAQKLTLKASHLPNHLKDIRSAIEKAVPHGRTDNGGRNDRGAWGDPPSTVEIAWMGLEPRYLKILSRHPKLKHHAQQKHLGTLGTGNHFIELCLDENDFVWVMLHSGSRGLGNRIGTYFISLARKEMERWFINLPDKDCAYLAEGSEYFNDYVKAVGWCQDFARENREVMMNHVLQAIKSHLPKFEVTDGAVNCHHNYVTKEMHFGKNVWVTRKGAVCARKGMLGLIPGSMGAKSFVVRGLGNEQSFNSCSHGAGRKMSRTKAKQLFSLEDHEKATEGVECRKDNSVIDETPGAYKDIEDVMAAQKDLVEVVHTLKQVLCVKG